MTKETIKEQAELLGIHVVSNCNIYGFKIGEMVIDIKEETEQKALIKLVNENWDLIDRNENIELYGLLQEEKDK